MLKTIYEDKHMVNYGVQRILREIPVEILYRAFGENNHYREFNQYSLEERIRQEVLQKIVLPDCNIVGGEQRIIDITGLPWDYLPNGIRAQIPLSLTGGRNISSVLAIEQTYRNMEPYGLPGEPAPTGHSEVYLVGPNTIFTPLQMSVGAAFLRCVVENDANMSNISQRASYVFGDLCVLAAKASIHTRLSINTTISAMTGGQVDGRLRGIIDGYADAQQLYGELLTKRWKKISLIQDKNFHHRLIGMGLIG